ncbi:MAG: M13 family metallopeptidase, partial [Acidimicrobiia bacterium]|nr:M13 family metallopeptidase [Acidimicrobiia bacterium]
AAQLRDVDLTTNKRLVPEIADLMPRFALPEFLAGLGADGAEVVNLNNPGFFEASESILSDAPVEVLRSYARWHVLRSFASALPPRFEEEAFDFYGRTLGGQQRQKDRWKRVLAAATREIGESVSRLYVAAAFGPEAKERCESMVRGLVDAMRRSISALTWMGDATKAEALAKLDGFTYKIGYPDKWKGVEGLDLGAGSWVENRMTARAYEFHREIDKLDRPVDADEWSMPAHVVNAYYHPIRNEIVFPAGILQPPFFYAEADDALNYGAIGAVIGHEITHGFDDQGSRFDADGHLRNWWTESDRAEFLRRAEVVVEQFSAYHVDDDLPVNGRLTLGENIADLGGVSIAYDAFRASARRSEAIGGMTDRQRFFLSYGTIWRQNYTDEYLRLLVNTDPHSPSMFRCNGPLANFPDFAEAFGIGGPGPMARPDSERAKIW